MMRSQRRRPLAAAIAVVETKKWNNSEAATCNLVAFKLPFMMPRKETTWLKSVPAGILWRTFSAGSKALRFCTPVSRNSWSEYAKSADFFLILNQSSLLCASRVGEDFEVWGKSPPSYRRTDDCWHTFSELRFLVIWLTIASYSNWSFSSFRRIFTVPATTTKL